MYRFEININPSEHDTFVKGHEYVLYYNLHHGQKSKTIGNILLLEFIMMIN